MNSEAKQLADYMSSLSEVAYRAGWMTGLEYVLWNAVVNGPRKYGVMIITDEHVKKVKELSSACGGWIVFDDVTGETFMPLDDWLRLYERNRNQLPDWINAEVS